MWSPEVDSRASVTTSVVAAAMVAVLVAAGVWLVASPAAPAGDQVGTNASEQFAAVDVVTATETTVVERGDERRVTVARVAFQPGSEIRRETVVSGDRRYELTVANDSVLWLYDEDDAIAKRVPLPETPAGEAGFGDRIERLFTALNVSRASVSETAAVESVSTLPVVPAAPSAGEPARAASDTPLKVRYDGTERVDGREAYVLHVAPASATEDPAFSQTLWVDTETFVPLQRQTEWADDGTPVSVTTTYENVTYDPTVGTAAFRFDPPAAATVETLATPNTKAFGSVQALRERATAPVPDAQLPPSFEFTYGTETTGRIRGAGVRYANETALVTAATYNRTFQGEGDRTVTVGDHEAVVDVGPTTSVSWNCGDYRYTVRGEGVGASFLVEVARSIECA
jgi:outer membrane lipoprotein-sorting protein